MCCECVGIENDVNAYPCTQCNSSSAILDSWHLCTNPRTCGHPNPVGLLPTQHAQLVPALGPPAVQGTRAPVPDGAGEPQWVLTWDQSGAGLQVWKQGSFTDIYMYNMCEVSAAISVTCFISLLVVTCLFCFLANSVVMHIQYVTWIT